MRQKKSAKAVQPWWRHKRTVLLAAGVIVLLIAVFIVYHFYAWNRYVDDTQAEYDQTRVTANELLDQDEPTLDTLRQLETTLQNQADTHCEDAPLLSSWRAAVDQSARQVMDDCEAAADSLETAAQAATELRHRIEAEQHITQIVNDANQQLKKAKAGDYAAQKKVWTTARSAITDQSEELDSYQAEADALTEVITNIITRYDGLVAANKAEKRPGFDDATVELRKAYEQLETVAESSRESYAPLANALADAVDNL